LKQFLLFEADEINQLKSKLGITKNNLIGIHIRDSNYDSLIINNLSKLEHWLHRVEPLKVFSKQSQLRNSNLLNFIPAISELDALNYNLIRFGNNSQVFPQKNIHPLIDYANSNFYSAKNDLILMSKLEYLICSASGLAHLAHWMRIPIFLIDFSDLFHIPALGITINSAPIILPKEIRYKNNNKLLTIEEIKNFRELRLRTPVSREYLQSAESKIYLLENNSETITKTILLGHSYMHGGEISSGIEFGKAAYQHLYDFDSYSLAPILSPYWANLNTIKGS
jgi:putative glycosyltransferase (TIGR04372 family)